MVDTSRTRRRNHQRNSRFSNCWTERQESDKSSFPGKVSIWGPVPSRGSADRLTPKENAVYRTSRFAVLLPGTLLVSCNFDARETVSTSGPSRPSFYVLGESTTCGGTGTNDANF